MKDSISLLYKLLEQIGHGIVILLLLWLLKYSYKKLKSKIIKPKVTDAYLLKTITHFREWGFFSDSEMTNNELLEEVKCKLDVLSNKPDVFLDLNILSLDESFVWWEDTEANVCDGNQVYIKVLDNLSRISRGNFNPQNITETWESEEGPITVSFKLSNKKYKINPRYFDDYIDIGIIKDINRIISDGLSRFEMFTPFDQTVFVIFIDLGTKMVMEEDRGWRFVENWS